MTNRDTFSSFHPTVNLSYFVIIIGFSMFFMHPISLGTSLLCSSLYAIYLYGKKALRIGLLFMLPMVILTASLNPLFNHAGVTMIAFLPNGNPITLESIIYGIAAATMLITVIIWFACLNAVMTSDKFIYLFGRAIPALSLILSMSLRFVPRFKAQIKVISNAQKGIGRDVKSGNIFKRAKHGIKILSIMITWALENAIETADSMKSRGYGLLGRTAFSIFNFDKRDGWSCAYIFACATIVMIGGITAAYSFRYFPTIRGQWRGFPTIMVFAAYLALGAFPLIVNFKEDIVWRRIKSKI